MTIREDITIKLKNQTQTSLSKLVDAYNNFSFRNRYKDEKEVEYNLRKLRHFTCFPVVDRGTFWYNELSDEQYEELKRWRQDWLDVTITYVVPVTPSWINEKLEGETIL
jgi:hypothetical protein